MGDRSADASVQIDFKIEPTLIPSTAIERLATFPHGLGGLGDVWKCSMSTPSGSRPVAVKSIRVNQSNDSELLRRAGRRIRREAYVWIQLSHDHIVPFEGIILDHDFGPLPALVSLWMENGTLNEYLKREFPQLSDRRKLDLIQQVAAGLSYLHSKDIAHGDLTPNNILLDCSGNLRLTDFGLSMVVPESGNVTFGSVEAGNTRWMAPEFVGYTNDSEEPRKPTKAGDIYSFGCVMLQIFTGEEPFSRIKTMMQVIRAMWLGQKPFCEVEINIDEAYKLLSSWCLSKEPETRPSILGVTTIVDPVKALAVASRPFPTRIEYLSPSQDPARSVREVGSKTNERCFPRSAVSLIAALEVLEASAETNDFELARAVRAILPNMQSSGETGVHGAVRKVLETGARNVRFMDTIMIIPPRPSTPTLLSFDNTIILGPVAIHPLLVYHPYVFPINYDVSRPPDTASANFQAFTIPLDSHHLTEPATNPPIAVFSLKSDLLPWCCVIRASIHHYITVEDVLYQLYRFLCISGTLNDYNMIPNQDVRDQIAENYMRRCLRASSAEEFAEQQGQGLKRVDFLIGRTTFMGLSSTKLGSDILVLNLQ